MHKLIVKFCRDTCGATAIEYGLVAGLIALVIIIAVTSVGTSTIALWTETSDEVAEVISGTPGE